MTHAVVERRHVVLPGEDRPSEGVRVTADHPPQRGGLDSARFVAFVEPSAISTLDVTDTTRTLLPLVPDGGALRCG
ncbi:hypothetical protein [Oryzihumus leptocrescens]|uniref:hypothetical protein n=1 Tax=Oryzihumus leptocrescens TaxID=297536 RepID=UPI00163B512B|nr:hypothetical protein [Oryzihumus leptocrescens]